MGSPSMLDWICSRGGIYKPGPTPPTSWLEALHVNDLYKQNADLNKRVPTISDSNPSTLVGYFIMK